MGNSVTTSQTRDAVIAMAIEQMPDGASLRDLAEQTGVDYQTIQKWLLGAVPEQYRKLQEQGLIARIVDADKTLDDAPDHVSVQRADRKCKYMRWDAERRLKHLFAPSQELTGADRGPIQVVDHAEVARRLAFVMASGGRTIDGVAMRMEDASDAPGAANPTMSGGASSEGEVPDGLRDLV